ncbi:response regulator transcription factor [Leptolyngbya cf. ectocarpi LEGE 11479]|uniref:Response regulator transcription factor n=1 Tax=Leptolyngbya cf. ectocarpi LEGE 11479 TaxID=1828722 RepID=A0A928WZM0_LEPEC|nr:response regulator [Leptolyngbya ectocarpi]MBE9066309.1 response regulator transcription factor [Leptolyngbya cf. ectocarpi LEGE 11479]
MATVLIFEDDMQLSSYWRKVLEAKNHAVYCCATVKDALAMATTIRPDVIVMDMMIKENGQFIPEGGLTLLTQLKLNYDGSPGVIGVSGYKPGIYNQSTALEIAKYTGIDLALYKPIASEQLLEAVEQLLANNVTEQ